MDEKDNRKYCKPMHAISHMQNHMIIRIIQPFAFESMQRTHRHTWHVIYLNNNERERDTTNTNSERHEQTSGWSAYSVAAADFILATLFFHL